MSGDLYRLIPEEGKHLAESHDTKGAYREYILMIIPINHLEQESLLKLKTINVKTTIMIPLGMKWMEM